MSDFDKSYFSSLYRSPEDKSSKGKLYAYLSVIKRTVLGVRRGPSSPDRLTLLDVGCGFGRFLKVVEPYFQTYGLDPSSYVIGEAKKIAKKTTFQVSTLGQYEGDRQFDIITAFDVLEHTKYIDASLKKVCSLLHSDGIFVSVVPVYDGPLGMIGGLLDRDPTHVQKFSRWQWLGLLKKYFRVIEKQGAIRYSLPKVVYLHLLSPWLFRWGQAILVVMRKL